MAIRGDSWRFAAIRSDLLISDTVHDADKNNVKVKVKSYTYGELNCDGLHILITFI